MSKWIKKELFQSFQDAKKTEAENTGEFTKRSEIVWPTPEKGTDTKAKVYKGRFLPNPSGTNEKDSFYVMYYYHMFQSGEKWFFDVCPKTYDMNNFCPFCAASFKLYQGTADDKKMASSLRRKAKFACNWYVISDPRDIEKEPQDKQEGKVKIYEFPSKVESKLKLEITNVDEGWGHRIFDPEEGVDFTLNVKSTKTDKNGKQFPDYADSQFARQPKPLGDEKEIENIMNQRHDLNTYVRSLERDEEDVINILKNEMIWSYVETDYYKSKGKSVPGADSIKEELKGLTDDNDDDAPFDSENDEDLLKELENMS